MNRRHFFFAMLAAAAGGAGVIGSAGDAAAQEADLPAPGAAEAQRFEYDEHGWGRGPSRWEDDRPGRRGPPPWSRGNAYGYREERWRRRRPRQVCRVVRNRWGDVRRVCTWR